VGGWEGGREGMFVFMSCCVYSCRLVEVKKRRRERREDKGV
jgi:hypothetical protein